LAIVIKIIFRFFLFLYSLFRQLRRSYFLLIYKERLNIDTTTSLGDGWEINLMSAEAAVFAAGNVRFGKFLLINNAGKIRFGANNSIGRNGSFHLAAGTILAVENDCIMEDLVSFELKLPGSSVHLGQGVHLKRSCSILSIGGEIQIHKGVFFNNFCSVNALERIEIGENTLFGEGVRLYDHNHNYADTSIPISKQGYTTGPIVIGKNCWIGSNVVILKNVHIGDHCIIGANNLIYKSIPPHSIVKSNATSNFNK
jgi:acetyltransferase-like isoleucine patch superfamily enzyme